MRRWSILIVMFVAGCGSGNDPLSGLLGNPAVPPLMVLPIKIEDVQRVPTSFGNGSDGIDFQALSATSRVRAVADGVVSQVDSATGTVNVTIYHNSSITSQVRGLSATTLRPGDYINAGADIGLPAAGLTVRFTVLAGGVAVCPAGFLKSDAHTELVAKMTAVELSRAVCQ